MNWRHSGRKLPTSRWRGSTRPAAVWPQTTLAVVAVALIWPDTPLAKLLGFHPVPPLFWLGMGSLVALYGLSAELLKRSFYRGSTA